jgi:hypothetical protein
LRAIFLRRSRRYSHGGSFAIIISGQPSRTVFLHPFCRSCDGQPAESLDSAIVLSKESAQEESFKLYARDIVDYSRKNPLLAELVTISACYSADEGSYSREGPVGLSWAFLRAGGPKRCRRLVGRVGRFHRATHGQVLRFAQQGRKSGRRAARRQTVIASRQRIPQSLLLGTLSTLRAHGLRSRATLG